MKKYKVAYNACHGGFGLSDDAKALGHKLSGIEDWGFCVVFDEIPRHDPILIKVLETLGERANGPAAYIQIAEVSEPYRIDEYDGLESVETKSSYTWIDPAQ